MELPGGKVLAAIVFILLAGIAALAFLTGAHVPLLSDVQNTIISFFDRTTAFIGG